MRERFLHRFYCEIIQINATMIFYNIEEKNNDEAGCEASLVLKIMCKINFIEKQLKMI